MELMFKKGGIMNIDFSGRRSAISKTKIVGKKNNYQKSHFLHGIIYFFLFIFAGCEKGDNEVVSPNLLQFSNRNPIIEFTSPVYFTLPESQGVLEAKITDADGVESVEWKQNSGPATLTIETPDRARTVVSGISSEGTYGFEVKACDHDEGCTSRSLELIVQTATGNQLPQITLPVSVAVTLPTSQVTLFASIRDGDGSVLEIDWEQTSGTPQLAIMNSDSETATITGITIAGTYSFAVTAKDNGGGMSTKSIDVVVSAGGAQPSKCSLTNFGYYKPFSRKSAHYRPIGSSAQYGNDQHPETIDWKKRSNLNLNTGGLFGTAFLEVTGGERRFDILCSRHASCKNLPLRDFPMPNLDKAGLPDTWQGRLRDNVLVIKYGQNLYEFYHFQFHDGRPTAAILHIYPINGMGHGRSAGERVGSSASGISMAMGALRKWETHEPSQEIQHVIQVGLNATANPQQLSRQFLLPATSVDSFARLPQNNNGSIPYGRIFALPPSVNIEGLGLTERGKRLARALRNYGFMAVDNGGGIRSDQDWDPAVINELKQALTKLVPLLRPVLNSTWKEGDRATGGGAPIANNEGCFE